MRGAVRDRWGAWLRTLAPAMTLAVAVLVFYAIRRIHR